jgi:hypothetical protein
MSAELARFDISQTSTLQAVATEDEQLLIQDLQKRVDAALGEAEDDPAVVEASATHRNAEEAVRRLQSAGRILNDHAKALREQIAASAGRAIEKLIESAAEGKPDYAQLSGLAAIEHKDRITGRAIERLVEHLTPLAQIARLRAESHALLTRAKAVERIAQQRAERVLNQLRDAVSDEVVLPVDMSKGVSGALLAQAAEMKRMAVESSAEADRLEKWYMDRNRKD